MTPPETPPPRTSDSIAKGLWIFLATPVALALLFSIGVFALFMVAVFGLGHPGGSWGRVVFYAFMGGYLVLLVLGVRKIIRGVREKRAARRAAHG